MKISVRTQLHRGAVKAAVASAPKGLECSIFVVSLQSKILGTLAPELQMLGVGSWAGRGYLDIFRAQIHQGAVKAALAQGLKM